VLAQGLGIDPHHAGDVLLRNAVGRQRLDLLALGGVGLGARGEVVAEPENGS
jgi:hypothetical protein